jgi:tetratricopeptide (TPR) repeat protein
MEEGGDKRSAAGAFGRGLLAESKYDYFTAFEKFKKAATLQPENHTYQGKAGFLAIDLAYYEEAMSYLQSALSMARKHDPDNQEAIASYLNNIGAVLDAQGDYRLAREKFEEALTIDRAVHGDNHPDVAIRLNNIGEVHRRQGDYRLAREKFEEALVMLEQLVPETHEYIVNLKEKIELMDKLIARQSP